MTDDQIKEWENKIKTSLLRRDSTLNSLSSTMKNDMLKSYTINGKAYSLSSFGISTAGYFSSGEMSLPSSASGRRELPADSVSVVQFLMHTIQMYF